MKTFIKFLLFFHLIPFLGFNQDKEILFNGSNLDGWIQYGSELWYVEDGELVSESGPDKQYGYLGT